MSQTSTRPRPTSSPANGKPESEILFQKYFKSIGPRTYAAQVKKASNGNHFVVLTEGKRDDKTGDVRKSRLLVFSEDFVAFFRMLHETAQFIRENPVSDEVRQRRERYWTRQNGGPTTARDKAPVKSDPGSFKSSRVTPAQKAR